MKVDIEKAAIIYFERFLVRFLDNFYYFKMDDNTKGQMFIEAITLFQRKFTGNKFPYGHNLRKCNNDIIDFRIHFNYKETEHYMDITMYPKLVERKMKLDKLFKYETNNKRNK